MSSLYSRLLEQLAPEHQNTAQTAIAAGLPAKRLVRIVPAKTLSISVSANECKQNCAHCNGHYLKGMTPLNRMSEVDFSNYESVLISGGAFSNGEVAIGSQRENLLKLPQHLKLNLHPGFQPPSNIEFLKQRDPVVSFDLPSSNRVIAEIFKLPYRVEDYQSLYLEYSAQFNTVPHVNIGLDSEECLTEYQVIDFLCGFSPKQLVFIMFRPTPGTQLAFRQPARIEQAIKVLAYAKVKLACPIKIGCMRPSAEYRRNFDILAWLSGCENFVQPDRTLLNILNDFNIPVIEKNECCAI